MNRRSFLMLPALVPVIEFGRTFRCKDHHFAYESVIGTSLDLVVGSSTSCVAEGVSQTIRREIDRLASVLDTRDPSSEISLLERSGGTCRASRELTDVLRAYEFWERRTGGVLSIRSGGAHAPRNVDALGKAYIIDRAAAAARQAGPSIDALLNIGGDIVVWGRSRKIGITDPAAWYDNAQPITTIEIRNAAVATSGTYARGTHLIDSRSGQVITTPVAATVVAADAVTANALATTLCLTSADEGLQLVESTPGAEALRIASGVLQRTSGFALLEQPPEKKTPESTSWPPGYHVTITLPLTAPRSSNRPYVAVWVEDSSGKLIRVLAIWANKSKYYSDLSTLWAALHGHFDQFRSVTRATRSAGRYELEWDGLDNERKPVPLGSYRITVETNQEHGAYAKQSATINSAAAPRASHFRRPQTSTPYSCTTAPGSAMKRVLHVVTHWALLTHIYISMAGLTLAVLFGATGLALNHQDFGFSNPHIARSEIVLDKQLAAHSDQAALERYLRERLGIRSPSTDYHDDPDQIQVTFAAPGARTVVTINRQDGRAQVEKESRGLMGRLGDLHKGFDSGTVWYWTIDVAALLIVISSLTGIITLLSLRHRRRVGFTIGALGVLTVFVIYMIWVPK